MEEHKYFHSFENGLTLLAEEMPWSEAVSYSLLLPCGTIDDPEEKPGLSGLTSEMSVRGAGEYDNRGLVNALETLGVESSEGVSQSYSVCRASTLAAHLDKALGLTADVILRPHFPGEELEPSKQALLQEIASLEDEPSRKMTLELGRIIFPSPWGRPAFGTEEGLDAITLDDVVAQHRKFYSPRGAILSIAGKIDWPRLLERVGKLFGDWAGEERNIPTERERGISLSHLPFDSNQTHIGLAWPAVSRKDPSYLAVKSGVGVLSGGMSSRLFTEVREKRGLCYSVYASYSTHPTRGAVFCCCGSSSDKAQEALDVIVAELRKLSADGITAPELARVQIRSKSGLVMELESTGARADAMARDWYSLGRVRSIEEIQAEIDALSVETVNAELREHPPRPLRLVTLGPEPLNIDSELLG